MIGAIRELAGMLGDDWRVRWHRHRADVHAHRLARALEARRTRIVRWTGRL